MSNDTSNNQPFRMTKSGKKLPIQIGSRWFADFDPNEYMPLIVLTDAIPEGRPGHVRHRDALKKVKRLMRHAKFGLTAKISLSNLSGRNTYKETETVLLNKFQSDVVAAALGDIYLLFLADQRHANLSGAENQMGVSTYMAHVKRQATEMLWAAETAETVEQADGRYNALAIFDKLLEAVDDINYTYIHEADIEFVQCLGNTARCTTGPDTVNRRFAELPEELRPWLKQHMERLDSVTDMADILFKAYTPCSLDEAPAVIDRVKKAYTVINNMFFYMTEDVHVLIPIEARADFLPVTNKYFTERHLPVPIGDKHHKKILWGLNQQNINVADPANPNRVANDVILAGLYYAVYDVNGAPSDVVGNLVSSFKAKYKFSDSQASKVLNAVMYSLKLPRLDHGLVIISYDMQLVWNIHVISWDVRVI